MELEPNVSRKGHCCDAAIWAFTVIWQRFSLIFPCFNHFLPFLAPEICVRTECPLIFAAIHTGRQINK